ncbi:hypothetical protein [uncultured Alistipes sp.]|uniref:hypothetical protein n=1 Tax=uncultured Alistipes sp. TaxID=538949 RepID=UPI002622D822|nr:hypothetical protein [uncultured Alistipes sp.]
METPLWETVILESPYAGVSIPYMVGKYYSNGRVQDLHTSNCIRIVLEDIVNTAQPNNEAAIFSCDLYVPHIPMIQLLRANRSVEDIEKITANNPHIKNNKGQIAIYLQADWAEKCSLDDLVQFFWNMYGEHIKQKHFSVQATTALQPDKTYHLWGNYTDKE